MPGKKFKPSDQDVSLFGEQSSREHGKDAKTKPKKQTVKRTKREAVPLVDGSYNVFALLASSLPMGDKATKKKAPVRTKHEFHYDGGVIEVYFPKFPAPDAIHLKFIRNLVEQEGAKIAKYHWSRFDMRLFSKIVTEFV